MNLKLTYSIRVIGNEGPSSLHEQVFIDKGQGFFMHNEETKDKYTYASMSDYAAKRLADDLNTVISNNGEHDYIIDVSGVDLRYVKDSYLFREIPSYLIVGIAHGTHVLSWNNKELEDLVVEMAKSYVRQVFTNAVRYVEDFKRM